MIKGGKRMQNERKSSWKKWLIANISVTAIFVAAVCLFLGAFLYVILAGWLGVLNEEQSGVAAAVFTFFLILAFMTVPIYIGVLAVFIYGIVMSVRDLKNAAVGVNKRKTQYMAFAVIAAIIAARVIVAAVVMREWYFILAACLLVAYVIVNLGCYFSADKAERALPQNVAKDIPPFAAATQAPSVYGEGAADGTDNACDEGGRAVISFEPQSEGEEYAELKKEHQKNLKKRAVRYAVLLGVNIAFLSMIYSNVVFEVSEWRVHPVTGLCMSMISLLTLVSGAVYFFGLQTAYRRRWSYYVAAGLWFIYAVLLLVQAFRAEFAFNLLFAAFGALFALTGVAALKLASVVKTEYERNKR